MGTVVRRSPYIPRVTEGGGTLTFDNEPGGFTLLTEPPWDDIPAGWGNETASAQGEARIVSDATAPVSPPNVLEEWFPTGYEGGTAPGNVIFVGTNGYTQVFVGTWFKMDANFEGHSSGVNKLMNLWTNTDILWLRTNAYADVEYNPDGVMSNGPYYLVATDGLGGTDHLQNMVTPMRPIVLGTWHKVEWLVQLPTGGSSNGRMRWWLDGDLVGDVTGLSEAAMGTTFGEFQISPTWGGDGGTKTRDSYSRFDVTRISAA